MAGLNTRAPRRSVIAPVFSSVLNGYGTATTGVRADLQDASLNDGDAAGDMYISIENLSGSAHDDNLRGDAGANVILGGGGDDFIYGRNGANQLLGGTGDDALFGGAGADNLDGGAGTDQAAYWTATAGVIVDLHNTTANTGDAAGDTYINIENLSGTRFNNELRGDGGANVLSGGDGNDIIRGRGGADRLNGGSGNDHLFSNLGADILQGGAGSDVFRFSDGFGQDRILDFSIADTGERIDLRNVTEITSFADLTNNHLSQSGSNAVIDIGGRHSITLDNLIVADLTADEFMF